MRSSNEANMLAEGLDFGRPGALRSQASSLSAMHNEVLRSRFRVLL